MLPEENKRQKRKHTWISYEIVMNTVKFFPLTSWLQLCILHTKDGLEDLRSIRAPATLKVKVKHAQQAVIRAVPQGAPKGLHDQACQTQGFKTLRPVLNTHYQSQKEVQ